MPTEKRPLCADDVFAVEFQCTSTKHPAVSSVRAEGKEGRSFTWKEETKKSPTQREKRKKAFMRLSPDAGGVGIRDETERGTTGIPSRPLSFFLAEE